MKRVIPNLYALYSRQDTLKRVGKQPFVTLDFYGVNDDMSFWSLYLVLHSQKCFKGIEQPKIHLFRACMKLNIIWVWTALIGQNM